MMNKALEFLKKNYVKIITGSAFAIFTYVLYCFTKIMIPFLELFGIILERVRESGASNEVLLIMLFGMIYLFGIVARLVLKLWEASGKIFIDKKTKANKGDTKDE
jgi:hypothetical protein